MPQSSASDRFPSRRFSSLARRRHVLRRAFFFSALSSFSALAAAIGLPVASAWGEDCVSVPETERAVCELQARCDALEDAERRQECVAAAETLRQTLGAEALETETIGAVEAPAVAPEPDEAEPSAAGSARGLPSQEEREREGPPLARGAFSSGEREGPPLAGEAPARHLGASHRTSEARRTCANRPSAGAAGDNRGHR